MTAKLDAALAECRLHPAALSGAMRADAEAFANRVGASP
jgi:hypothetical protein